MISSEDFEYCVEHPERLADFERALRAAGWEPWYLVLFRRQRSYAVSLHAELIRHGLAASFPRFVAEILRRAKFVMKGDWCFYFDYAAFLDRWRRGATGAAAGSALRPGRGRAGCSSRNSSMRSVSRSRQWPPASIGRNSSIPATPLSADRSAGWPAP